LIWLCWLVAIVLLSFGCDEDVQPTTGEVPKSVSTEPNVVEVPKAESTLLEARTGPEDWVLTESTDPNIVKTACELIYEGRFEDAGEVIEQSSFKGHQPQVEQLAQIIQEYRAISIRRLLARKDAYTEKLAELEKYRPTADNNDVNDVNDISKVLAAISRVSDFANEHQKAELLSDSLVKQVFQKAIDKAAEFESKGKWLDAYTTCYWWLAERIDPDNQVYSDYAEQLYEKANIVASFRDSPCETRKERYEGVKKEMFVRAIGALDNQGNQTLQIVGRGDRFIKHRA